MNGTHLGWQADDKGRGQGTCARWLDACPLETFGLAKAQPHFSR